MFNPQPKPDRTPPKLRKPLRKVSEKRMKEGKVKRKAKLIKPMSIKRMVQMAEYKVLRDEYMEDHKVCEVKECFHISEHLHHRKGRSGKLLNETKYWMAVCHYCHGEMHNKETAEAYRKGYMILRSK